MKVLKTIREIVEAVLDGKEVEFISTETGEWLPVESLFIPVNRIDDKPASIYRFKSSKPSIDWNHVHPKYNYLAKDRSGTGFLYENKPELDHDVWQSTANGVIATVEAFKSLDIGDCDWTESLVERPRD